MLVVAPNASAATPNTISGCKSSNTPGAEMGMYPAWPGSQSYLRVACIFQRANTPPPGDQTSATFTIHDFSNAVYHNGAARTVTANAAAAAGATSFTVADCTSMGAFVNRTITGPGIAARTFLTSVGGGCTINLNKAIVAPGIANGNTFLVENSTVRSVTDATLAAVSPMVTSATANFTAADVGLSFDGTNVTPGTTITAFISATQVDLSVAPTAGVTQTVTIGGTLDGGSTPAAAAVTTTRTFNDATSAATNTITSTAARFNVSDIGLKVAGTGITQPCYIATRTATVATLSSACATINATPYTVTIGDPSRTAPTATDTVMNQGVQLPLNPVLVAGSQPCAADDASGFGIEGTWLNPGSFVGGAFATQPPNTKAVGEILFTTSVITYGAYVLEIPGGLGIDPLIGGYHFNIVFPNVPTSLALCPSTATSPGLGLSIGINGTTVSQAAIAAGVGRPATAQLRSTRASTTGATTTVFITDDVNGAGTKWTGASFNRTLIIPAGTPDINFVGGDG